MKRFQALAYSSRSGLGQSFDFFSGTARLLGLLPSGILVHL